MRVSDYVFEFLKNEGAEHVFMLSGGGIMYLVNSLGHSGIEYVCCHHEQAAGIAAQAYAMKKNGLGICMATTGPGGTNILTAVGASYVDSTPVLYLTGQVKTADFASKRNVRQFGAQENDIVSMAKPVTKYAVTVMDAGDIRYHLEKALYLALNGRQGPVLLDIPLDVQNEEIDPKSLRGFDSAGCEEEDIVVQNQPDMVQVEAAVEAAVSLLLKAKRPLILAGQGLVASNGRELFLKLQSKLKVPVVASWRALDFYDYEDKDFYGSPGLQAPRYSNLITQGADFLLVLGSRMDNMITAFDEEHFAYRADKVIVDIDKNEINKLAMTNVVSAVCDVSYFLSLLDKRVEHMLFPDYTAWKRFCTELKEMYPILGEKQAETDDLVDLYRLTMTVSEYCVSEDTIVISSTSRCNTAGHIAFKHRAGQKTISSMGFGSMGFALPSVIGAWYAGHKSRVIMFEGDGSLQLNIQEFQTIACHHVNAKMFIFNNQGYAAIATMQDRNFDGFHVGSDAASGVSMPDLSKIADAYGIPYVRIASESEIQPCIQKVMDYDGPVICEFLGSIKYDEIPKCISSLDETGRRVSAKLENPFPFLPEEEMEAIYNKMEGVC